MKLQPAAHTLNAEIKKAKQPPAAVLHYALDGIAALDPCIDDTDYSAWSSRVLLLATLAVFPGDLSQFGACGRIPWKTELVKVGRRKHQVDFALGRDWMLFDIAGHPHLDLLDRTGEHVATHYGEMVDGKVQSYVKRTPWRVRGRLGEFVDKLIPILAELGINKTTAEASHAISADAPPKQAEAPAAPRSRKKTLSRDLAALERSTPPSERGNGKWVRNTLAARLEGVQTRTLGSYRQAGICTPAKTLGRDKDGRVWRRDGTPSSHPWYLRSTLKTRGS